MKMIGNQEMGLVSKIMCMMRVFMFCSCNVFLKLYNCDLSLMSVVFCAVIRLPLFILDCK